MNRPRRSKSGRKRRQHHTPKLPSAPLTTPPSTPPADEDYATFETLPRTYQEITDHFSAKKKVAPFALRKETFLRIERATRRPLIAYVTKLRNVQPGAPAFVEDGDLVG